MSLKEYENQLYSCSRCGLCQKNCEIFEKTRLENVTARGILLSIYGVLKGDIPVDEALLKNIIYCKNCNQCQDICPSGIDLKSLLTEAEAEFKTKL